METEIAFMGKFDEETKVQVDDCEYVAKKYHNRETDDLIRFDQTLLDLMLSGF